MTNQEKLKLAVEQDMNPKQCYMDIIKKIEKKKKYPIWKLSFIPTSLIVIISGILFLQLSNKKENILDDQFPFSTENDIILNINQLTEANEITRLDLSMKTLSDHYFNIPYPYKEGHPVMIPTDLDKNYNYLVYNEDSNDIQTDNRLYHYVMVATDGNNRSIYVAYSKKYKPLGDDYLSNEKSKVTIINDTELKIYQLKNNYFAEFYYNDYNFSVETLNITEQELSNFLVSILK